MATMARRMRANKSTETPRHLVFFDTESYSAPIEGMPDKTRLTLRLWVAISLRLEKGKVTRRKIHHGKTAAEFWQTIRQLARSATCLNLFAHNVGHDCTQLLFWEELDAGRFVIKPQPTGKLNAKGEMIYTRAGKLILDGPPTCIVCRDSNGTYKFVDTLNYWRTSLSSLGKSIGLGKRERPSELAPDEEWSEYCLQDCRIIEYAVVTALQRWLNEDCGVWQITGPALALTNFRHTCNVRGDNADEIDIIPLPDHKSHKLERDSYYGGRTTCYFVGHAVGTVWHLDCNSLYPFVMSVYSFPRRFVRYQKGMSHDDLRSAMRVYGVVARVFIKSRDSTFPVRIDGEQYHTTGQYWTSLCGPELQRALDDECIYRIGTVQLYSVAPLFAKWVSYWYDRKIKAVRAGHNGLAELEFVKLILCSLSGKWAQRGRIWLDRPDVIPLKRWGGWPEKDCDTGAYEKWRGVAGNAQILTDNKEPSHAFPAISAFITSHGREYMLSVIRLCPPGSVYYMATDSLICDARAYDVLERTGYLDQYALGKFKIVGKYSECEILGPNHYRLDGKETASGHMGKLLACERTDGRIDLWERLPTVIADGPRNDTILTSVPVEHMRPDHRGIIDRAGYWQPYHLTLDPDFGDRPVSVSDLQEYSSDTREGRIP